MAFICLRQLSQCANRLMLVTNSSSTSRLLCRSFSSYPVRKAFEEHEVVPDVVSAVPASILHIKYMKGEVKLGNELRPTDVSSIPIEISWTAEKNAFYTLVMTDPDAPSRQNPTNREWHHWLVVNIPGTDVSSGDVLSAYVGSGPPKGSGLHRYVFLVYKQPNGRLNVSAEPRLGNRSGKGRNNFRIAEFARRHKLGNPVAGNFYQAQFDDYVPKLYAQLSGK